MSSSEDAEVSYGLGPALVTLSGASPSLARALSTPPRLPAQAGANPMLVVRVHRSVAPPELAERQGDSGDGLASATMDDRLWWRGAGRWAAITVGSRPIELSVDGHETTWRLAQLVSSIARRSLPSVGASAVHGSVVDVGGRAVVICGWAESGKTEVGLALAIATGGELVGDKWTVVASDRAWPFPGNAGLRHWMVSLAGDDLAPLGRLDVLRGRSAGLVGLSTRGLRRVRAIHPALDAIGEPFERLLPLVPTIRRAPDQILARRPRVAHAPGQPLAIAAVVLLLGGHAVGRVDVDRSEIINRLRMTTLHEEAMSLDLDRRAAYGGVSWFDADEARQALENSLANVPVLAVSSPFPADPRPAAEFIESCI